MSQSNFSYLEKEYPLLFNIGQAAEFNIHQDPITCWELVPQDPNDELASVLLERIKAEREGRVYKKKERLSMAAEERGEYGN